MNTMQVDDICPPTPTPPSSEAPPTPPPLEQDLPCEEKEEPPVQLQYNELGVEEVPSQTRKDIGVNHETDFSLDKLSPPGDKKDPVGPCVEHSIDSVVPRNPITGLGLNGDGVGGLKPKKLKTREGNPVTGEGYKAGATDYVAPTMNGANQVINKNRIPPGGYSSGLW